MIEFERQTGTSLAESAIVLARQIGDPEIEADALVTRGSGRIASGDAGGLDDLNRALGLVGGRGRVAGRGFNNLGWAYAVLGDVAQALRVTEQEVIRAEREGDEQSAWFARGKLVGNYYAVGHWDEALDLIDSFDAAPEGARYQLSSVRCVLADVLAARDRPDEALDVIREVVTLARPSMDPQAVWPSIVVLSRLARERGLRAEAESALDEVTEAIVASDSAGDAQQWHIDLVLLLVAADRFEDAIAIVERLAAGVWRNACTAVLEERHADAVDIVERTGEQPLQAELRLRAAAMLVTEGRLAEAQAQLESARAFWTSVGATAYLRETDDLFAAAS